MPNAKRKHNSSKQFLMVAIGAVSILLVILVVLTVVLSRNKDTSNDNSLNQTTQVTDATNPSAPAQTETIPQPSEDSQTPAGNVPTESSPLLLERGLYIVHIGNFSGKYVEDGSDAQLENFCAVIVENRSESTVQLLQFEVVSGEHVYDFSLTTLPPGERAIVQEKNRSTYVPNDATMVTNVDLCNFFPEEPSLHEDVFGISGTEYGIELRNLTDTDIPGPIYVYYKTRTADGYGGGITYRISVPGLEAKGVYNASVSHFWPGSSQVMFIDYVQ